MLKATVNAAQLEEILAKNAIVFVDFWAEWCAPCKQFGKIYDEMADSYPSIAFAKVNIEKESELAETFQIRSIPHLMIFKEGIVIYSDSGSMPKSILKELIEQALVVDVSDIRAQIEAQKKEK